MAKKKSGNKTWIAGAVLGAVAGAAYALWKTPMSGGELRSKLAPGPVAQRDDAATDTVRTATLGDRILGKVEETLAPIVGVELGKTANGPAPLKMKVSEAISVPDGAVNQTAEIPVVTTPQEENTMTEHEKDPKFKAAEPTPDPGRNTDGYGSDSIRAKRFAWGSPTPEAGVQPVPTEPMQEDPVTEPAMAREPAAPGQLVPPGEGGYGKDSVRSQRFAWGDPAPDSTTEHDDDTDGSAPGSQPLSDQLATAGSTTAGHSRPLEAVSDEAGINKNTKREFPKLGGLEDSV